MAPEARPTILVVDDTAENRELARGTLEDEDYTVVTADSGEAALRAFDEHRPDCVLLDVRMPRMDGFATCARLRSSPGGQDVPILFLTALRDVDTFDRALRAGGDDFLTKPVRPTELVVRVQAALKVRRMSAELREQVDLVRRQRDDLLRLQLQKERLTGFVVHDLKNPVNAMDLHAQLLLRDPSLSPVARESVLSIRDEARALLRLVLNLLDISKSEEGQLVVKSQVLDLGRLVSEVLEAHQVRAEVTGVTLHGAVAPREIVADLDLLRRVLENLIDNALRHAPPGSQVQVSCEERGAEVILRVADAGRGIAAELRERVFERFVQLEAPGGGASRGGRGLGLTFCKLAVEAHGGRIWVEDASPGALFCVALPHASR